MPTTNPTATGKKATRLPNAPRKARRLITIRQAGLVCLIIAAAFSIAFAVGSKLKTRFAAPNVPQLAPSERPRGVNDLRITGVETATSTPRLKSPPHRPAEQDSTATNTNTQEHTTTTTTVRTVVPIRPTGTINTGGTKPVPPPATHTSPKRVLIGGGSS